MINQKKVELGYELHDGDVGARETNPPDYEPKFLVNDFGLPTHILPTKKFRHKPNKKLTKRQRKAQKKLIREIEYNREKFLQEDDDSWKTPPPVTPLRPRRLR